MVLGIVFCRAFAALMEHLLAPQVLVISVRRAPAFERGPKAVQVIFGITCFEPLFPDRLIRPLPSRTPLNWLPVTLAGKDIIFRLVGNPRPDFIENGPHRWRDRPVPSLAIPFSCFMLLAWYRPNAILEIKVAPLDSAWLSNAAAGNDGEFDYEGRKRATPWRVIVAAKTAAPLNDDRAQHGQELRCFRVGKHLMALGFVDVLRKPKFGFSCRI